MWVAHEFESVKPKLVPTVCPPQKLIHSVPALNFNLNDVKNRLLYCVCFLPNHSGHQVRWTYGVTKEEAHTGFLIHLLSAVRALFFLARRIQASFLSLVDREVEFLCALV